MKKKSFLYAFLTAGFFFLLSNSGIAQHTEYSIMGGTGLFHYKTANAKEPYYSTIVLTNASKSNYANNPYGDKNGYSYQLSFELKKVTRSKIIWGSGLEFESVQSKKNINWVLGPSYSENFREAQGHCTLENKFLSVSSYIGYRFNLQKFYWDMMVGPDIAIGISPVHQQGMAIITSSGEAVYVDQKSHATAGYDPFEMRARLQSEIGYKKWGLYLGYSWGFYKGHLATMGGTPLYSFSRYFRAGILYRLK